MLSAKYVQTTRAVYVDNDIANVKLNFNAFLKYEETITIPKAIL